MRVNASGENHVVLGISIQVRGRKQSKKLSLVFEFDFASGEAREFASMFR